MDNYKNENLENNLYQRVDPWCEDIQIYPIQNPNDTSQRIFLVFVPKSKNPPHMANYTYCIRLNFQTKLIGHEQVSNIFRQYYLQKYDLVNTVYGPLYNELTLYLNQKRIFNRRPEEYERICWERQFLIDRARDPQLRDELNDFYQRIYNLNKAIVIAPFRLSKIINEVASGFFIKPLYMRNDQSAIGLEIRAESTWQYPNIDQVILNRMDPLDFWKEEHPHDRIMYNKIFLEHTEGVMAGHLTKMEISPEQFKEFMSRLKAEIKKDELISYIWKEFASLPVQIKVLLAELKSRM